MEPPTSKHKRLISATVLERDHGVPKVTAYKLAKARKIPFYNVGPKLTGIRFIAEEVFEALRVPYGVERENALNSNGQVEEKKPLPLANPSYSLRI